MCYVLSSATLPSALLLTCVAAGAWYIARGTFREDPIMEQEVSDVDRGSLVGFAVLSPGLDSDGQEVWRAGGSSLPNYLRLDKIHFQVVQRLNP